MSAAQDSNQPMSPARVAKARERIERDILDLQAKIEGDIARLESLYTALAALEGVRAIQAVAAKAGGN